MSNQQRIILLCSVFGVLAVVAAVVQASGGAPQPGDDEDAEPSQQIANVDALAATGSSSDAAKLRDLVNDDDPAVAIAALRGLGQHHDDESLQLLREFAQREDADPKRRAVAAAALGKHERADVDLLTRMVRDEPDDQVRAGAALGLAHHASPASDGDRQIITALIAGLRDRDPAVRRYSIAAVHRMTVYRFMYDPAKDPRSQEADIRRIQKVLRSATRDN